MVKRRGCFKMNFGSSFFFEVSSLVVLMVIMKDMNGC